MATLLLRFEDAERDPLDDTVDVDIFEHLTNTHVANIRDAAGTKQLRVPKLLPGRVYRVRVFPKRYRAVQVFITTKQTDSEDTRASVFCPVLPERVNQPDFPTYKKLDQALRTVLGRSTLERDADSSAAPLSGEALYESLDNPQKAGLLNLYCKMANTWLGTASVWDFVETIDRVRGDRVYGNVAIDLRDKVKSAVSVGFFREVDGSLHKPPVNFKEADSFKTDEPMGNLQLTFFSSLTMPLRFRIDADIDDAAGLGHVIQVLNHAITKKTTNPYDIHQILVYYQSLPINYGLPV